MFSGGIEKQDRTAMGHENSEKQLLVSISKYVGILYIWQKKKTHPPIKLSVTICKIAQIFVTSLL